jgi:hypothetical protein
MSGLARRVAHLNCSTSRTRRCSAQVRYEPIDIPTFAAGLTAAGASAHFVQHISNVAQDYRDGVFAGVNNLVEVIGGVKPITVEEYVAATPPLTGRSAACPTRNLSSGMVGASTTTPHPPRRPALPWLNSHTMRSTCSPDPARQSCAPAPPQGVRSTSPNPTPAANGAQKPAATAHGPHATTDGSAPHAMKADLGLSASEIAVARRPGSRD